MDELRSASGPGPRYHLQQDRLTAAMTISLFAVSNVRNSCQQSVSRCPLFQAAEMAQDTTINAECTAAFRPQMMAAAMHLLRFVLNEGSYTIRTNALNPPDHLDTPTSVIIRWGIVPQWAWSVWSEYNSLYADTIVCLVSYFSV